MVERALHWLKNNDFNTVIVKWETKAWGEIPADFGSGECWGFFRALQALSGYYDANQKPLLHICAPESATAVQFINIFVSYVDRNPTEGHIDGAMVATNALVKAFPCQKK